MSFECKRTIGMWMYQNGGGSEIEQKMIMKLLERGINSVTGLNLRYSEADKYGYVVRALTLQIWIFSSLIMQGNRRFLKFIIMNNLIS